MLLQGAGQVADLVLAALDVGQEMARAPSSRTRSAARARRSTGRAISWCSRIDDRDHPGGHDQGEGQQGARSAAMISSTSPASRVSTPSTACTCWIGIDTETTRSPFSATRTPETASPRMAWAISALPAPGGPQHRLGLGVGVLERQAEGRLAGRAGGSTLDSTRSATM
jgi:hypothetical protein